MGTKETSTSQDMDISIAYQNKDIVSKLFGDRMKGKPLSLFGLEGDLRVVDVRPTNIPVVRARELRMDNLFELEDGSIAILDYESSYKKEDFIKYGYYIIGVAERYLKEGRTPDIHMMVLYTADVKAAKTVSTWTACSIQTEAAYLMGVPSERWLGEIREGIEQGVVTDEVLMHLVILPLTYKGEAEKQKAIRGCVDLARQIPDKEQETFALAGILTFTDKVINEETKQYIKEVLEMTQVGKMLFDEGREKGRQEGRQEGIQEGRQEGLQEGMQAGDMARAKKTALNMLKKGGSIKDVAEILELSTDIIRVWEEEACAVV